MSWETLQGRAKEVGSQLRENWAKLSADDLSLINTQKEVFLGKLQERTGLAKEEAEAVLEAVISQFEVDSKSNIQEGRNTL